MQKYRKKLFFTYLCVDFMTKVIKKVSDSLLTSWINRLVAGESLVREEWKQLLSISDNGQTDYIFRQAAGAATERFGKGVFIRGLIEISAYCRNDCYYCGLRRSNRQASRYRLTQEEILSCCRKGAELGFGTFVLQGGEDRAQDDGWIEAVVRAIRSEFPLQAITLSVGERTSEAYLRFRKAGADRYLLRHETRNDAHYALLHPKEMSGERRRKCLRTLKDLGYQTGAGMMVGSPGQTVEHLLDDIVFLEELQPEMIGMGPFIPAAHTPFAGQPAGSVERTLLLVALMRLRFPDALIPATTALATLGQRGRTDAILAGANVVMPNLSPEHVKGKYSIYDGKACRGNESAEGVMQLQRELETIGYHIAYGRGDYKPDTSEK